MLAATDTVFPLDVAVRRDLIVLVERILQPSSMGKRKGSRGGGRGDGEDGGRRGGGGGFSDQYGDGWGGGGGNDHFDGVRSNTRSFQFHYFDKFVSALLDGVHLEHTLGMS